MKPVCDEEPVAVCDCINEVNDELEAAGINTQIDVYMTMRRDSHETKYRVGLRTHLTSNKKRGEKLRKVMAIYCPFCGRKYE